MTGPSPTPERAEAVARAGTLAAAHRELTAEVMELDSIHEPDDLAHPRMCSTCGPADGSWPCVSRMIADRMLDLLQDGTDG